MTIKCDWENREQTILMLRVTGEWHNDTMDDIVRTYQQLTASVDHVVDTIIKVQALNSPPCKIITATLSNLQALNPAKAGMMICVNKSVVKRGAFSITQMLNKQSLHHMVPTLDDAYRLIHEARADLADAHPH